MHVCIQSEFTTWFIFNANTKNKCWTSNEYAPEDKEDNRLQLMTYYDLLVLYPEKMYAETGDVICIFRKL